ncbi:sugar transporter [Actinoplanes sp. NBRC 14428]|uniref:Carbohydrate ABC transporter membrane protein 1 (CUT1 family) n=1 Tax=Pseudosporangium ferrugineum TaxID=439699 RepID=A0A2T0S279_9ACTN|nr:sugar ABC transporter permease [Pseudosporangium ferrugineum]PRY27528.1 carbohydrate ABC transporter membrane protein 1 (CUT1 family) [Pseudosporangium ferrugineum]BCJ55708.1 sugar transporter [Actinoplanes sp. NBRC 14428]
MTTVATAPPRRRRGLTPLWLLLPTAVVLGVLFVYPMWQLGLLSVLDFRQAQVSGGQPTRFLGAENYTRLFGDPRFWSVLTATVAFAAACVAATLAVGAGLAVLLTRISRVPRLLLSLAAMAAWAVPSVSGSTVWMFLFDTDLGLVNQVLGLDGYNWMYDRYTAFALVGAVVVWHSFPFVMVTLYAGIEAIPRSVLEAAAIDGSGAWRTFWRIMVPILRPLIAIVVIQSIIWDFKVFTQIYVMTRGGGIAGQNLTLNVWAYQQAFASGEYGLGAAIGVVMMLILLVVTLLYLRTLRRSGEPL